MTIDYLLNYWKTNRIVTEKRVLEAFKKIDRRLFVPQHLWHVAYQDTPLPLLKGQTISQPTTVAIMTQALRLKPGMKVFEVGAGSGYQAALIGYIVGDNGKVITLEYFPELADMAKRNLIKAGIKNVKVITGDGSLGYPKEAPYDRIILTCAAPDFPPPFIKQLKENGIILAPLGNHRFSQQLIRATKRKGKLIREALGSFVFVPLRGKHGFKE